MWRSTIFVYNLCFMVSVCRKTTCGSIYFPALFCGVLRICNIILENWLLYNGNISQSEFSGGHSSTRQIQSEISLCPPGYMSLFSPQNGQNDKKWKTQFFLRLDLHFWFHFLSEQECEHWVIISHYIVQSCNSAASVSCSLHERKHFQVVSAQSAPAVYLSIPIYLHIYTSTYLHI